MNWFIGQPQRKTLLQFATLMDPFKFYIQHEKAFQVHTEKNTLIVN